MSTPTPSRTPRPFSSTRSLRLLGNAIALAAATALMAYGCERGRSKQPPPTPPTPTPASQPATPPSTPAPSGAPANPAAGPDASGPPPTLVPPKPGEKTTPPEPAAPEQPKLAPIPHEDLGRDAKALAGSEFTIPTGVVVQEFKRGAGAPTLPKAIVTIHFVLHVQDGWKKIQSTYEDGAPETYQLEEVVFGMADGIIGMTPGSVRRIIVPASRGFADKGVTDKDGVVMIPPGATLVYDIELVSNKQRVLESPAPGTGNPVTPPRFNAGKKDDGGK